MLIFRRSDVIFVRQKYERAGVPMSLFRVLVTDNISEEGIKKLTWDKTIEVDVRPGIKGDELVKIIGNYDAIITRSGTPISAALLRTRASSR